MYKNLYLLFSTFHLHHPHMYTLTGLSTQSSLPSPLKKGRRENLPTCQQILWFHLLLLFLPLSWPFPTHSDSTRGHGGICPVRDSSPPLPPPPIKRKNPQKEFWCYHCLLTHPPIHQQSNTSLPPLPTHKSLYTAYKRKPTTVSWNSLVSFKPSTL